MEEGFKNVRVLNTRSPVANKRTDVLQTGSITSKFSNFKGDTQHLWSKIAKIRGCQTVHSKNSAGARHPWHPC